MEITKTLVVTKIEIESESVTVHLGAEEIAKHGYGKDLTMMFVSFPLSARNEVNIGDKMEVAIKVLTPTPV
jgi:Cu/Ag efflux protein CusF